MSTQARPQRLSIPRLRGRKGGDKLVCLTAYTASVARLLDDARRIDAQRLALDPFAAAAQHRSLAGIDESGEALLE